MRPLSIIAIIAVSFISLGCSKRSLTGTWESTGLVPARITFNADKTFQIQPSTKAKDVVIAGNYSVIENRIKLTDVNVEVPENTPFKTLINGFKTDQDLTLSWKTDDEIILDGQGMLRGGFKRVKE